MAAEGSQKVYCNDSVKELQFHLSCFRIADESVKKTTNRIFKVGDISVLSDLKELIRRFGLEWNFVSTRSGKSITCNCDSRTSSFVASGLRKSSYIVCGCGWLVRFRGVEWQKCTNSDPIIITGVCGVHSNTCNPDFLDQCVLSWTRSSIYKKCADHSLQKVMVQMYIEPFVSVRAIRDLLFKVLPDKKIIDRHIINNVRIRARQRKRELENSNIEMHPKHFDTSFY